MCMFHLQVFARNHQFQTFLSDARQTEVDFLQSWAVILNKFLVSIRIKILGNANMAAWRLIKRENGSLPVDVRCSKTSIDLDKHTQSLFFRHSKGKGILQNAKLVANAEWLSVLGN